MKIKTENEAIKTVRQDGCALGALPEKLRTPAVCGTAAERDGLDPELVWQGVCE